MAPKFDIDTDSIRKLAKLLEETGLGEVEYAEGDRKIRISAGSKHAPQPAPVYHSAAPAPAAATAATEKPAVNGTPVPSPMVGTVYLASGPDAAPFVKAGDTVKQGDTLVIIEAMKVMNPIKAPKGGKIVEILVSNASPVEFGETLLVIA
jgi:acetyl-CoA carboxylase biotin carboxyl carrier protein